MRGCVEMCGRNLFPMEIMHLSIWFVGAKLYEVVGNVTGVLVPSSHLLSCFWELNDSGLLDRTELGMT